MGLAVLLAKEARQLFDAYQRGKDNKNPDMMSRLGELEAFTLKQAEIIQGLTEGLERAAKQLHLSQERWERTVRRLWMIAAAATGGTLAALDTSVCSLLH